MKFAFAFVATALWLAFSAAAFGQVPSPNPYPTMAPIAKYLMPSAAAEVALARAAGPSSISAHAEVLVLTSQGYVVGVEGHQRLGLLGRTLVDGRFQRILSSGICGVSARYASIRRPCEAYYRNTWRARNG